MGATKPPYLSPYERACTMLALEAAELSEGEAARLLGWDRLAVRDLRLAMIAEGKGLTARLEETPMVKAAKRQLDQAKLGRDGRDGR